MEYRALSLAIKTLETGRTKGMWIYQPNHTHLDNVQKYHCSTNKCGWQQNYKTNFCPNCGADMRGKTVEDRYSDLIVFPDQPKRQLPNPDVHEDV